MGFRSKVARKQPGLLWTNVPPSVHTMNGHLPFIILGGQPASTLHADQGFGAREKAGRAYFGGNAPRIRFRYRTRSLSIGPLPCGFSVKNLPRHWSQTPIYIYIYHLIPSINHPSNLPLPRPIFSCSNKPRPENHFPFHLHSNIYIYSKKTRCIIYKTERSMRKCGPFKLPIQNTYKYPARSQIADKRN